MTASPAGSRPIEGLRSALTGIASTLGLHLSSAQEDALLGYLALLCRWNETYNLTAVREPAAMLAQHLADCLAIVQPLLRQLGQRRAATILDVGSGAGLPGVVLAVTLPHCTVVCVDKVGKKAAFIRQVALELNLPNLQVEHSRVESLSAGAFDVIVSRAFGSLSDLVLLSKAQLAANGVWLAMKGVYPNAELGNLPKDVVFHVEPLHVPGLAAERCLVWLRRRQ